MRARACARAGFAGYCWYERCTVHDRAPAPPARHQERSGPGGVRAGPGPAYPPRRRSVAWDDTLYCLGTGRPFPSPTSSVDDELSISARKTGCWSSGRGRVSGGGPRPDGAGGVQHRDRAGAGAAGDPGLTHSVMKIPCAAGRRLASGPGTLLCRHHRSPRPSARSPPSQPDSSPSGAGSCLPLAIRRGAAALPAHRTERIISHAESHLALVPLTGAGEKKKWPL
jgi:hypothetical protein